MDLFLFFIVDFRSKKEKYAQIVISIKLNYGRRE